MSIWRSRAREVLLTAGAVLGSLCLLMVAAGLVLDVRPLVFRSGSMAPAIETGDLAIAQTVDATELVAGDVVSVFTESGQRVTHRVVASGDAEGGTALMLRGDANDAIDAETYVVESADKVLVTLPKAGYAVGALQSTGGALVLGGLLVVLFTIVVRGDRSVPPGGSDGGARRRAVKPGKGRRVARRAAVATFGTTLIMAPAMAAPWTDDVEVTGPSFSALTVQSPAASTCSSSLLTGTITWTADVRYDYEVVLKRASTGAVVSTRQVPDGSVTYSGLSDFGLVVGAGTVDFTVEVRSYLANTPSWRAQTVHTAQNLRVFALVIGATVSCGTPSPPAVTNSCTVVSIVTDQPIAGQPCTVTNLRWSDHNATSTAGQRAAHIDVQVNAPNYTWPVTTLARIKYTVNVDTATKGNGFNGQLFTAGWSPAWIWSGAKVYSGGSGTVAPGYPCASLPAITAYMAQNSGTSPVAQHVVTESGSGFAPGPVACT